MNCSKNVIRWMSSSLYGFLFFTVFYFSQSIALGMQSQKNQLGNSIMEKAIGYYDLKEILPGYYQSSPIELSSFVNISQIHNPIYNPMCLPKQFQINSSNEQNMMSSGSSQHEKVHLVSFYYVLLKGDSVSRFKLFSENPMKGTTGATVIITSMGGVDFRVLSLNPFASSEGDSLTVKLMSNNFSKVIDGLHSSDQQLGTETTIPPGVPFALVGEGKEDGDFSFMKITVFPGFSELNPSLDALRENYGCADGVKNAISMYNKLESVHPEVVLSDDIPGVNSQILQVGNSLLNSNIEKKDVQQQQQVVEQKEIKENEEKKD